MPSKELKYKRPVSDNAEEFLRYLNLCIVYTKYTFCQAKSDRAFVFGCAMHKKKPHEVGLFLLLQADDDYFFSEVVGVRVA